MTKQDLLAEILRLPPGERIALLGEAWDSIAANPAEVPIPEWHVQELERRLAKPDHQFLPWEEVRSRLRDAGQWSRSASARRRPRMFRWPARPGALALRLPLRLSIVIRQQNSKDARCPGREEEVKTIIHTVYIAAPTNAIFEALTTEQGVTSWWSTKADVEAEEGGVIQFTFRGDFNPHMRQLREGVPSLVGN